MWRYSMLSKWYCFVKSLVCLKKKQKHHLLEQMGYLGPFGKGEVEQQLQDGCLLALQGKA